MTGNPIRGGATGSTGRRLRRMGAPPPPGGAPAPLRRGSPEGSKLIAGLFAAALALGLGGTLLVLDAPAAERDAVSAAFAQAPLRSAAAALAGDPLPPPAPPAPAAAVAATGSASSQDPTSAGNVRSTGFSPRRLSIPSLGLETGVLNTGMTDDRNLEVPADPQQVGWYRGFAEPGDPGVSVLLGHVDSREGPGIFFRLPELDVGERIEVERSDGRIVTYEVERVEWVPKHDFPTEQVYTSDREQVLRLITCGGEFDPERRTYLENIVVTATPIDLPSDGASDAPADPESRPA